MSPRAVVSIGATIGSIIGGYIPTLWGAGMFSFSSLILSAVGGLIGIYITYKMMDF